MKRETSSFIVAVVIFYALALGARACCGATTNDYTFTPPGFSNINVSTPVPTEWIKDSGWQAIQQIKRAAISWASQEHDLAGRHQPGVISGAMIADGAIQRRHFESNVTAQLAATNGYAQLPLSDVFLQWVWTDSPGMKTSSIFSVSWPRAFSNQVWGAWASVVTSATNYQATTWSSNEWALAKVPIVSLTGATGNIHISGAWTTQYLHRACVFGLGR